MQINEILKSFCPVESPKKMQMRTIEISEKRRRQISAVIHFNNRERCTAIISQLKSKRANSWGLAGKFSCSFSKKLKWFEVVKIFGLVRFLCRIIITKYICDSSGEITSLYATLYRNGLHPKSHRNSSIASKRCLLLLHHSLLLWRRASCHEPSLNCILPELGLFYCWWTYDHVQEVKCSEKHHYSLLQKIPRALLLHSTHYSYICSGLHFQRAVKSSTSLGNGSNIFH